MGRMWEECRSKTAGAIPKSTAAEKTATKDPTSKGTASKHEAEKRQEVDLGANCPKTERCCVIL